jgi:hypothetical protein
MGCVMKLGSSMVQKWAGGLFHAPFLERDQSPGGYLRT